MIAPAPPLVADIFDREFLSNSLKAWLTAGVTAAFIAAASLLLRRLLVSRLGRMAARTPTSFDDMAVELIRDTRAWVIVVLAIAGALTQLELNAQYEHRVSQIAKLVLLWQLGLWGASAVKFWVNHQLTHRSTTSDRASVAMLGAMEIAAKVLLWMLLLLTALNSVFDVHITALITAAGVGGIALALAVQNILGDVLAALAIVFDKPFDIGDSIGVDQISGTVEHIGLKTTRVRSVNGEQVIIGNADLLKSRLRNYKRMYQRRNVLTFDVTYDTPPHLLERLPAMLEEIITAQSPVKFDRCHVASLGESAIRIEAVYYVLDPDYKKHMDIQQSVLLEAMRRFAALRVEFAFPTQTVYHESLTAAPVSSPRPPQSTAP